MTTASPCVASAIAEAPIDEIETGAVSPVPDGATEESSSTTAVLHELLANRDALISRIDTEHELRATVFSLVAIVLVGDAIFGAALGLAGGGIQSAVVAVKLPVLALAAAAICVPALHATRLALLRAASFGRELARVLAAFALASVVLAALAPIMLLAVSWELAPEHLEYAAGGCCFVAGLFGTHILARGSARRERIVAVTSVVVIASVTVQMARTLGPFVGP
jgi:hypothetical protein